MTPRATRFENTAYISERVIPSSLALFVLFLGCSRIHDLGVFGDLAAGHLILERGELLREDCFSYSSAASTWTSTSWLFQSIVAVLDSIGGLKLISLLRAACLSASFALLWWGRSAKSTPGTWNSAPEAMRWFLPTLCMVLWCPGIQQATSLFLFAAGLWLHQKAIRNVRWFLFLPVYQVLWGGFGSLAWLGPLLFGWTLFQGGPRKPALLSSGGAIIALLANPYGLHGFLAPLEAWRLWRALFDSAAMDLFQVATLASELRLEGLSPRVGLLLGLVFLWIGVSLPTLRVPGPNDLAQRLFELVLLVLSCIDVLFVPFFALVVGDSWVRRVRSRPISASHPGQAQRRSIVTLAFLFLATVAVPLRGWAFLSAPEQSFSLGEPQEASQPILRAVRFAGREGMPAHAWVAPLKLASVYSYAHGPKRKVFADPRFDVIPIETYEYTEEILRRMDLASPDYDQRAPWDNDLRLEDGTYPVLLLGVRDHLAQIRGVMLSHSWQLVYADRTAAVFFQRREARLLGLEPADPTPLFWASRL